MSAEVETGRRLTFRALGSNPVSGVVKNPQATLGTVAAKAAARIGLAGTYECLDAKNEVLSPEIPLADLPEDVTDITLASELTPARVHVSTV